MSFEAVSTFATLPRTARGHPIVLGGDPKGKNFLYTNGNSVIIRDIKYPELCDVYTQHSVNTTVAKYAPSGFYIASGDVSGKIRIWDTTQAEHILKFEFQPLGGAIKDIAWSPDSQRIVAVGEGREKFGHVFSWDSGNSVGEITGQSKALNSVDFHPSRPFRIATASEDNSLAFYEGPPFKFKFTMNEHSSFVNCVRYSPSGEVFISGGAEGKAFIYDGKNGALKGELGSPAHDGGIYGLSFHGDGQILTVSADKRAKIWDVATSKVVQTFTMGTRVDDMQVGCLWQGPHILSVSLSGFINYLDVNNPKYPLRILKGHNKPITALTINEEKTHAMTGSTDGRMYRWDLESGHCDAMEDHTSQVQDMATKDDTLVSCGMDDMLIFRNVNSLDVTSKLKMPSQPWSVSPSSGGLVLVACFKGIVVVRNRNIVFQLSVDYEPLSIAVHPGQSEVAVGGGNNILMIYTLNQDTLQEYRMIDLHSGGITGVDYSSDGAYLVAVDKNKKLTIYKLPEYEPLNRTGWGFHAATINSAKWSPDSKYIATSSLDTNLIVWNPAHIMNPLKIAGAHLMYNVSRVLWKDNNQLISAGYDGCVKRWTVTH